MELEMKNATNLAIDWIEQGLVPDAVIRAGIRRLLKQRLAEIGDNDAELAAERKLDFIEQLGMSPLAILTDKANAQHYEVPAAFFAHVLGKHRKYSSCWWPQGINTLDDAEFTALTATCERAGIADRQDILELGCGWGSLTLWMATHYPDSKITAVSNSLSQRAYIEEEVKRRGLRNVLVITCDMNDFRPDRQFDRIVSVEMFEHMRNWPSLFGRVAGWLDPDGLFFMHVFVHRMTPYAFVEKDTSDWMSRHFFSGGMMPSDDMPLYFQDDLKVLKQWRWDGTHYEHTSNAWLANMDANRAEIWPILEQTYGRESTAQWWMRWRIFFMSCAELFGYENGQQWWVSHTLFRRRK
jgi:cyclopropane-fatty-acyl-phospholipid synthase